jgi:hypothetical protein
MNAYLGTSGDDCVGDLMRAALMSVANTAIIPFQDILKLGNEARRIWHRPRQLAVAFSWDMLPGSGVSVQDRWPATPEPAGREKVCGMKDRARGQKSWYRMRLFTRYIRPTSIPMRTE